MSADNGIYILITKDTHKVENEPRVLTLTNMWDDGIVAYRVAYASGVDNLEWLEHNQPYNVGAFLKDVWGDSKPVYFMQSAYDEAAKICKKFPNTEYGVVIIERQNYCFPL